MMTTDQMNALRNAHWLLSCRFTSEMRRLEKERPEMLVEELRSDKHLSGRILRAIKVMEELYPELGND